jgi:predicted RNase H-like HicB family nuclease
VLSVLATAQLTRRVLAGYGPAAARLGQSPLARSVRSGTPAIAIGVPVAYRVVRTTVSEQLTFHVDYADAGDGWTLARVREIPAIVTQGATVDEAREMVGSALRDWLEHYVADQATEELEASRGSEPLPRPHGRPRPVTRAITLARTRPLRPHSRSKRPTAWASRQRSAAGALLSPVRRRSHKES